MSTPSATEGELVPQPPEHVGLGERVAWLVVVGGGLLVQVLLTISGIISARLLGVEGRGEIALVAAVSLMGAQLTLGGSLPVAVTKQLAERGLTARDGLSGLGRRWSLLTVGLLVPFGGLLVVLHGDLDEAYVWWLGLLVVLLAVENVTIRLVGASMLGEQSPLTRIAVATLLPQSCVTVGLVILFVLQRESTALVVATIMAGGLLVGLVASLALLKAPTGDSDARLSEPEVWRVARANYLAAVGPIDGLGLDRTLVGAILGTSVLGLYAAAVALASLAGMLGSGLATVLLPRLAAAQGDPAAERRLVRRWLVRGALTIGAVTAVVTVVSRPVIELAFGQAFSDAALIAHWLVPAIGILGFRRLLVAVLQARDRGSLASWVELTLTPALVLAIVVAALLDSVQGVGVAMFCVALLSVSALSVAVVRTSPTRVAERSRSRSALY